MQRVALARVSARTTEGPGPRPPHGRAQAWPRSGLSPLAQPDVTPFKRLMAGEHCPHGFANRDIRARLASTQLPRSCADDPKRAGAKLGRCFRRLHAHGLRPKIPRTRRLCMANHGRNVMGTSMVLREHRFPDVHSGVAHGTSSPEAEKSRRKNLSPDLKNFAGWPERRRIRLPPGVPRSRRAQRRPPHRGRQARGEVPSEPRQRQPSTRAQ